MKASEINKELIGKKVKSQSSKQENTANSLKR